MLNNFINYYVLFIFIFIIINIFIRLYKYFIFKYNNSNIFSITVEKFVNINNYNVMNIFTFKSISLNSSVWKSKKTYLSMLKAVLYIINKDYSFKSKISIVFFEVNPVSNKYNSISDGLIINLNDLSSHVVIFNRIKWNKFAFDNDLISNHNNIVIVIKFL